MESSVSIPITFWNSSRPTLRISSVRITPNGKKLVTSSCNGELSIWNLNLDDHEITLSNILIGHSDPVTCLECTDDYAISTSEGGEICRWNLDDGYCSKTIKSVFVHRNIQIFKCSRLEDDLLFTSGDYHEIFIIHAVVLHTILVLHSKTDSDWISCFHVISSQKIGNDIVSGVTKSGFIKLWIIESFSDEVSYEVQSKSLPVKNVSYIKCNYNQTQLLTISDKAWTIFDAKYLKKIYTAERIGNEKFAGGDFHEEDVLIWTKECRFYVFKLEGNEPKLSVIISGTDKLPSLFEPATSFHVLNNENYFIHCDVNGFTSFWKVDGSKSANEPYFSCDLNCKFDDVKSTIFEKYVKKITCTIIITELELFVIGCSEGTIVIASAIQMLSSHYFNSEIEDPQYRTLEAHEGRINCLLYPYEKYSYHNKSHLLSGGSDFSVCLWDIFSCKLIHKFCVQSGEIIKLLIPPGECKIRVRNSVCSVANDHSVALLNLKELKCIVLASRQLFPVVAINWRPLDDLIIIECFDGTVYVWELETGHLDRVLHGITAQEVIYACKDSNHEDVSNFYLKEDGLVGKDNFRRGLFQIDKNSCVDRKSDYVTVRGFLDNFNSENQIIIFKLDRLLGSALPYKKMEVINIETYLRTQALTHCAIQKVQAKSEAKFGSIENLLEDSENVLNQDRSRSKFARLLLSILRARNDDQTPVKTQSSLNFSKLMVLPRYSLISESQNVSIFMSKTAVAPALITYNTIANIALTSTLDKASSRSSEHLEKPDVSLCQGGVDRDLHSETLARLWQSKCPTVRKIARKLLLSKLESQTPQERSSLLQRYFKFLPHFKFIGNAAEANKMDAEIAQMRTVALVLFGVIGSEFKFRIDDSKMEETYAQETCSAIMHLLQENARNPRILDLQIIAFNMLGRGYARWEQHLKFDKLFQVLFEIAIEYERHCRGEWSSPDLEKCLNAHETLKSIAVARTDAFLAYLKGQITQIRNQSPKAENAFVDKSKTEIILILTDLLDRTPYIMLQHLDDIVTILVYCISPSHLKQQRMDQLIPVLNRFKQVDHSLATQRIAVGTHDGNIVLHELKTLKIQKIPAHGDSVSIVLFSPDGKILATYSCFENRLCFWHVVAGMFGLGHTHVKCIKVCDTKKVREERIRNYLEIGRITWIDHKSVELNLCDDSRAVFHV